MPPRAGGPGKKGGKGGGADEKREDVLQAVVIADSFHSRFNPFAVEKPRVRKLLILPCSNVRDLDTKNLTASS